MRVALVSREYPPFFGGGIGSFAEAATRALTAAGHEVRVVTQARTGDRDATETHAGARVERLALPAGGATWGNRFLSFAARAGKLVTGWHARGEVDVVEFADTEAPSVVSAWVRAIGGPRVPTVLGLHTCSELVSALGSLEPDVDATRLALFLGERVAAAEADGLTSPSEYNARWFQRFYDLPETPAVVRYPLAEPIRAARPIVNRRVLYIGRIEPRKGVEPLVDAWSAAARGRPGWSLRLVGGDTRTAPGGGSLQAALEARLPEDVRPTVTFAGSQPRETLAAEIDAAAVVVIPSRWDNFPNTCMEAMAGGRAVIVGDVGGTREMVEGTEGGLVVRSNDARDLARGLEKLLGEPAAALEARGRVARARIAALCDPPRVAQHRVDVYRAAIERAASKGGAARRPERLAAWRLLREAGRRGHGAFAAVPRPVADPDAARSGRSNAGEVASRRGIVEVTT